MKRRIAKVVLALVVLAVVGAVAMYLMLPGELPRSKHPQAANKTTEVITRGEYLARAGDCVACHTSPGAKEFAGGRVMPTPFGNMYVPNITPDEETGIGAWTADEFYRMMHNGVSRDGTLLYPVMPFASYTKVTREDSDAIYAYLMAHFACPASRSRPMPRPSSVSSATTWSACSS